MAKDSTTQVERKIVQIQSGVKDRIEIYHGKMILMGEDYIGQLKHFQDDRREFVQTTNQLARRLDRAGAEIARWEIQHDLLKRRLYGELAALQRRYNVVLDDLHGKTTVDFEALDGKVLQVSQHSRIAIINLGRDDLLRTGLLFQVYPTRGGTLQSRTAKATLEVTRILGPHRSEARILSDRDTNPVLPGDAVDSMTWQPGEPAHFALAGLLDLDGDGKSDRLKVHALIKKQGGVIDAEVDERGERSGRVTHNTRYSRAAAAIKNCLDRTESNRCVWRIEGRQERSASRFVLGLAKHFKRDLKRVVHETDLLRRRVYPRCPDRPPSGRICNSTEKNHRKYPLSQLSTPD
jgi:hypothetical protein